MRLHTSSDRHGGSWNGISTDHRPVPRRQLFPLYTSAHSSSIKGGLNHLFLYLSRYNSIYHTLLRSVERNRPCLRWRLHSIETSPRRPQAESTAIGHQVGTRPPQAETTSPAVQISCDLGMHAAVGERRCIHLQQRPYPDVWNSRRTAHCVCVLNVPAADKEGQRLSCDAESLASYGGAALMHSPTTTTTTRGACSLNGEVSDNNLITHLPSPTPALLVSSISVRGRRPP